MEFLSKFRNNKARNLFFTVIFLFISLFSFAEGRDIIVMIDISASMSPYFQDVLSYFNDNLLQKYVRQEDTLTILSFSRFPETEIIKEIIDIESYRSVLNTVAYSKPFGLYTDLVSAIKYLYQEAAKLPETRKKKIFLITDGIHDPPPGSPYVTSSDVTIKELLKFKSHTKEGMECTYFTNSRRGYCLRI